MLLVESYGQMNLFVKRRFSSEHILAARGGILAHPGSTDMLLRAVQLALRGPGGNQVDGLPPPAASAVGRRLGSEHLC